MQARQPSRFKAFPWATLGRRETTAEFFRKHGEQQARARLFKRTPLVTFVVRVRENVSESDFADCVAALRLQSYPHWEAIFVAAAGARRLESVVMREGDRRMRWLESDDCDAAVGEAKGEYVAFPEPDAIVSPVALYLMLLEKPADVIFSNEVRLGTNLRFLSKSEGSEFNLLHFDAVGNLALIRREKWRPTAGTHELFLRLIEAGATFVHAPYFLYYRRSAPAAADAAAVRAHLARRGWRAEVRELDGRVKVRLEIEKPKTHLISAIIPFRDRADWTVRCLAALENQVGGVPLEVVLVNNESTPDELAKVRAAMATFHHPVRLVDYDGPFNYAEIHNVAVRKHCRGDLLLLLNNDVFLQGDGMLDELAGWALRPTVGTVGICLRYGHGPIQHSGIRARAGGEARIARVGHFAEEDDWSRESHEVFANTFAASMLRRETFDVVGGLRALDLANGFGDVAFNFECLRRGLHNLYLGHLQGVHLESASRGLTYEYWEEMIIEREYPDILQRMLRQDLGYGRVPEAEFSVPAFLRGAIAHGIRTRAPWLDPIKPSVKKLLRSVLPRADNRSRNEPRP